MSTPTEEFLVNAAFLLVTTALMTGQPPAKIAPAPAHGPHATVAPAACGPSCCDDNCCRERFGARLRERLRGLFSRDDCCETACHAAPVCHPAPVCCDDHHGRRDRCRKHFRRHDRCEDDCCDNGGLLSRLRGLFRRNNDCCDTSCCGSVGGPGHPVPRVGEPIPAPKKMPKGSTSIEPNGREVRIITPPSANPIANPAPALETAPAVVPNLDTENRNPF
jgi:hypothetical protein